MHVKNSLLYSVAVSVLVPGALLVSSAGCSQKELPPQPTTLKQQPSDFSFRVTGSSAESGITFRPNKSFEVGPAPNGQVHRSRLKSSEHTKLERAWEAYQSTAFSGPETCQEWPESSPYRNSVATLEVLEATRTVLTVRSEGGSLCGKGDAAALRAYAETLLGLGKARYPSNFPSECLALQDEFSALADSARSCTSDLQCTHVDPQFEAIPEGQIQYVSLKSCSAVPAIPTANREALPSVRRKLLQLKQAIRTQCQPQGLPAHCAAADELGFQNHRYPAKCVENVCTSDPGAALD
ncbi:MAG: hypothetical protein ACK5QT_07710 [Oligoflexia bacterium]